MLDRRPGPARGNCGSRSLHRVDHRDRVGVGLALDRQHDRAVVVEPARDLVVLDAVDDVGDLVELDRRAVAIGHHDVPVVRRPAASRPVASSVTFCSGAGQRADRRVGIGLGEDACGCRRARCCAPPPPPDRPGRARRISARRRPAPARRREAAKSAAPARSRPYSSTVDSGSVGEFRLMNSTGKSPGLTLRKHGGVVISIGSRRCATVERGLHVERGAVDVAVEVELDDDLGLAERRRRRHRR